MILIYCPEENPRVTWTFDLVFRQLLGSEYRLTTFADELTHTGGPCLNYSFKPMAGIPFIEASGLLFEHDIRDQSARLIPGEKWAGLPTIFLASGDQGLLPFDIFSAIFYFVSRYEEYLPYEPDEHHRFRSTESLAFHLGIIEKPIVNQWVNEFAGILKSLKNHAFKIQLPDYQFIPTIDIDNAWAYAHKGFCRTIGGIWRDRRSMEARNFRYQVLRDNQPDPFNTYGLLERFHNEAGVVPVWFFLLANHGRYDKSISPGNSHLQSLIRKISTGYPVGIHPSYASNSSPSLINQEIQRLAGILGHTVTRSRQHYLRLHLPDTYRTLSNLGIKQDYSMGYASHPGFRAGIAIPFRFFNLEADEVTPLTIHPVCLMDVTMRDYLRLSTVESLEKIKNMVQTIRSVNGEYVSLWHNESLCGTGRWTGWKEVYAEMVKLAST